MKLVYLLNHRRNVTPQKDSILDLLRIPLVLGQCIGLVPLDGVWCPDKTQLRFRWCSIRVVFCIIMFTPLFLQTCLHTVQFMIDVSLANTAYIIFFSSTALTCLLSIKLAMNLPGIISEWEEIEKQLVYFRCSPTSNYSVYIKCFYLFWFSFHTCHAIFYYKDTFDIITDCIGNATLWTKNYTHMLIFFFKSTPLILPSWIVIIVSIYSISLNYFQACHEMIIVFCVYRLTHQFHEINHQLNINKNKVMPSIYWQRIRETYDSLSQITRILDEHFRNLIFITVGQNFVLLINLIHLTSEFFTNGFVFPAFFHSIVIFVIVTACAILHEETKKPLLVLISIPFGNICKETERFTRQVAADEIGFDFASFGLITRDFISTIVGAVISNKLLLLSYYYKSNGNVYVDGGNAASCFVIRHLANSSK